MPSASNLLFGKSLSHDRMDPKVVGQLGSEVAYGKWNYFYRALVIFIVAFVFCYDQLVGATQPRWQDMYEVRGIVSPGCSRTDDRWHYSPIHYHGALSHW